MASWIFSRHRLNYQSVILLLLMVNVAFATELDESNGPSEYYHQKLHVSDEAYLVQYERIIYTQSASNGLYFTKDKLEISAVIEKVFKGQKKRNEIIKFHRLFDSDISKSLPQKGQRFIVFFDNFNGKPIIDPQDPASVWPHSKEITHFLSEHF